MTTLEKRSLLLLALLAAACDRLTADPGADFGVRLVGSSSLTVVGKLSAPVQFAVSGCDAFDAAIRNDASSQAVVAIRQEGGTWLADVPVEWLRTEDHDCLHDALRPLEVRAELVVTCGDGGRSASAALDVSYGTATRAYESYVGTPVSETRYLFPGPDALRPSAMFVSWAQQGVDLFLAFGDSYPMAIGGPLENGGVYLEAAPLAEPRLVATASGSSFAYSTGCAMLLGCPDVAIDAMTSVPSEAVAWIGDGSIWWQTWVPKYVLDMAMIDDRHVVVLSQPFPSAWSPTSVLSVITKPPEAAPQMTVLGYFPGEWVQSRFSTLPDGRLAWLAWVIPDGAGPIRSVLRTTEGASVEVRADPTGDEYLGQVWDTGSTISYDFGRLSPDGSEIVLSGARLVGADGATTSLPASNDYGIDGKYGDAVWLRDAIALWRGTDWIFGAPEAPGVVEVFDPAPPHARRFEYRVEPMPGGGGNALLYGAVAVGDKLVLTTGTGIRVLGPDGALVGGADPLPCGLSTTSRAARVGPTTVAVGAGTYWYVFDLAEP
jgi:hypothetical protein